MFKVLLVDDEPWALLGLEKTFKWKKYGFQVIYKTTNPMEALESIKVMQPDVVFTDIKMPMLTGIDLMEQTRLNDMDTEFVVVSGFSDFSYAQQALRQGAYDYYLKPLDVKTADEFLIKLQNHLRKKDSHRKHKLFDQMINERCDTMKILEQLGLSSEQSYYQAFIIKKTDQNCDFSDIKEYLHEKGAVVFDISSQKIFGIVNNEEALVDVNTQGSLIGMSSKVEEISKINVLYEEADLACHNALIYKEQKLFEFKDYTLEKVTPLADRILTALDTKMQGKLKEAMKTMPTYFREHALHMGDLVYLWNQLASNILKNYPKQLESINIDFSDYAQIASNFDHIDEVADYLYQAFEHGIYAARIDSVDEAVSNDAFKDMLSYIDKHFHERLFLKDLAGQFYINENYCCKLFKKVKATTFSGYVTDLRMQEAAKLLKRGLSVQETSETVGYNDYYYFNKVFKKHFNITPFKYRKVCGG